MMVETSTRGRRGQPDGPHPVDVHVGDRIRARRKLLGMTQTALGDRLGLTFQQVQKYERGANRVGAGRLFELTRILGVPVSYFFEGIDAETTLATPSPEPGPGLAETQAEFKLDPLARHETLDLVRAYYRIADPRVRKRMFELTKALGKTVRSR